MFLVKKATKPLGIGSIVQVSREKLEIYYKKKSGGFNDKLTDQKYIILAKINSCEQNILRVLNVYTGSYPQGNANYFMARKKARLTFLALSVIEDAKQSYLTVFGYDGKKEVQDNILKIHGANIARA